MPAIEVPWSKGYLKRLVPSHCDRCGEMNFRAQFDPRIISPIWTDSLTLLTPASGMREAGKVWKRALENTLPTLLADALLNSLRAFVACLLLLPQ